MRNSTIDNKKSRCILNNSFGFWRHHTDSNGDETARHDSCPTHLALCSKIAVL